MKEHRPEVTDVFRTHGDDYERMYGTSTSAEQRRVLRDLSICRTAALGGHKKRCDRCGHEQVVYNSCRNRHCPKCQAAARKQWLVARQQDLLDVPYFHVVFTVPEPLGPLALHNKRVLYGLIFRAASDTLATLARDPKHLGAEIGFLAVLHTWGENLHHHPHLHCVVPGGGLSRDPIGWVACANNFFLPVRVLSRLFRGKFLSFLQDAFDRGQLRFSGKLQALAQTASWKSFMKRLRSIDWVVYAKPPFGGAPQVLKYLARYTHRVAISNQRLVSIEDGKVSFLWKDYAHGNQQRTMTLDAVEFIRRFLLHVLPKGFVRIRYYGFLAHPQRKDKLALIRNLSDHEATGNTPSTVHDNQPHSASSSQDNPYERCPRCQVGTMILLERIPPADPLPWDLLRKPIPRNRPP